MTAATKEPKANGRKKAKPLAESPATVEEPKVPSFEEKALAEIQAQTVRVIAAQQEMKAAKSEYREAKAAYEDEQSELLKVIANLRPVVMPLFDHGKNGQAAKPDDAWKSDPLAEVLNLSAALVKKLAEQSILTMGDLVAWTDPNQNGGYQRDITQIPGVGPSAAAKIGEATEAYWARRATAAQVLAEVTMATVPPADGAAAAKVDEGLDTDDSHDEDDE